MIGSHQPKIVAKFYERVFNAKPDMEDGDWTGWQVGNIFFSVGEHSEVKGKAKEPQRLIFNFETKRVKEEFERISKIEGVKVVKEPYEIQGAWIATLADPDGNFFQLMTPWNAN